MATVKTIDAQTIGERLRALRGSRTQKEVGDAIGVTAMAISTSAASECRPMTSRWRWPVISTAPWKLFFLHSK